MIRIVIAMGIVLGAARDAGAVAACTGGDGWSPRPSDVLPPRARVVYWRNDPHGKAPEHLVATIDGKTVATKVSTLAAAPFELAIVDIDSDRTGTLELEWQGGRGTTDKATFTVKKGVAVPKKVRATTDRYHAKIGHSTVNEVFDGLAIHLDAPAVLARVQIRRDAGAAWSTIDTPVVDLDGYQLAAGSDGAGFAIRLGDLGCKRNYEVALLENGVDLNVEVTLLNGTKLRVEGLDHVVLAKLKKPTSRNPSDSE
jgi:hypothetical protein